MTNTRIVSRYNSFPGIIPPQSNNYTISHIQNKYKTRCKTYLIVVGCEYRGQSAELMGCARDARNIAACFRDKYGIPQSHILLLTEDNQRSPNRSNILGALEKCIQMAANGECSQIIFYYSGHGTGELDRNGDELDGQDEVILPNDYSQSGVISDDLLYQMFQRVPSNCKTLYIFDSCNSGTMGDLDYAFSESQPNQIVSATRRTTPVSADSICISGCQDDQTSTVIQENGTWESALTLALLEILRSNPGTLSLSQLQSQLRSWMIRRSLTQRPMVTFSNPSAGKFTLRTSQSSQNYL